MDVLDTIYENNAKAAHEVSALVAESISVPQQFSTRPFNRFDAAFTEWWMIPGSDCPAYKYGKLCFWRYPSTSEGLMHVGYHVEKGLHTDATGLPEVNSSLIMQQDWRWLAFQDEVKSDEFLETIRILGDVANIRPRLLVHAHDFNKVPKEGQPRSAPSDAFVLMLGSNHSGTNVLQTAVSTLAQLNSSKSILSVIESLSQIDLRFHWIDLIVGLPFRYSVSSPGSWNAHKLWKDALLPWLPWVR